MEHDFGVVVAALGSQGEMLCESCSPVDVNSVGDEIGGESEVEGFVGATVLVVGGQGGEGGVVAVAPRPREVGEEGVSEDLLGVVEPVGEIGAEAVEEEPAMPY
ncbi:hypothetical protein Syun_017012 [Stephania yunnanensis]|uniref:Uncharacterized protein n=1 Tax=Stephania yunnanensis TaxID=152371 RepID=A0AAP0P4I3_9MAGN